MSDSPGRPRVLITGGAGFIGANLAASLLGSGEKVRILDSLARSGSEENLEWLRDQYPHRIEFLQEDVRDASALKAALPGIEHVFHLAAQVAVTTGLAAPHHDFDVNARGTLALLEAARAADRPPSVLFTSTSKVYGALPDLEVHTAERRWVPADDRVRTQGIDENRPLDFHGPYACSKGAADQYVLDYARNFRLRTIVLRMSSIYGPRQHGNSDQGWAAHFVRCAARGTPITLYGDGRQVRDLLFIDDLVDALERAYRDIRVLSGRAFNIGGGPGNTTSLLELVDRIGTAIGRRVAVKYAPWRNGDQRYYVSDTARFRAATGWRPHVELSMGVASLCDWFDAFTPTPPRTTRRAASAASQPAR